jgi:putative FmdB family regulatory protein
VPIYDYVCSNCGHLTEVVHGINDHGPKFCPECGAEGTMTKAFAPPTIHFKGSGWAKKDRSSSSARSASSKKDDATPKAGASGSDSGPGAGSSGSSSGSPGESGSSSDGSSSSSAAGD